MNTENVQPLQSVALSVEDEFDPLEDLEPEIEDETDEFYGEFEAREEATRSTLIEDNRPAEERIAELFTRMKPRRKVLMGILAYCREPQTVEAVNVLVDDLQKSDRSVFTAASFCAALEAAGALIKQTAEGTVVDEEALQEPEVVVVDGVEYLEAAPTVEIFWKTTREGLEVVEADKPLERLTQLFEKDTRYLPIYKRVLTLCATEDGATADELGTAVDKDPLVQEPRYFAPYFFDKLERCDALHWNKTWQTTEVGQRGLGLLAHVADEASEAAAKESDLTRVGE